MVHAALPEALRPSCVPPPGLPTVLPYEDSWLIKWPHAVSSPTATVLQRPRPPARMSVVRPGTHCKPDPNAMVFSPRPFQDDKPIGAKVAQDALAQGVSLLLPLLCQSLYFTPVIRRDSCALHGLRPIHAVPSSNPTAGGCPCDRYRCDLLRGPQSWSLVVASVASPVHELVGSTASVTP